MAEFVTMLMEVMSVTIIIFLIFVFILTVGVSMVIFHLAPNQWPMAVPGAVFAVFLVASLIVPSIYEANSNEQYCIDLGYDLGHEPRGDVREGHIYCCKSSHTENNLTVPACSGVPYEQE